MRIPLVLAAALTSAAQAQKLAITPYDSTGIYGLNKTVAVPMIDSPHNHQATPAQLMPYTVRSEAWLKALRHGQPVPPR
jgi:hypothetical protein